MVRKTIIGSKERFAQLLIAAVGISRGNPKSAGRIVPETLMAALFCPSFGFRSRGQQAML